MGRKKLAVKKIENLAARQTTFFKRKDGILRKASELSVLCDTDVGLIMFAPSGHVVTFSGSKRLRVEDIFLQFVDRPDELRGGPISNGEFLSQKLRQAKYEGEMLDKIAIIEELEEKLDKLTRRQREAQDKMRYYEPDVENIRTGLEAEVALQFLTSAINRLEVSKTKLLGSKVVPQRTANAEEQTTFDQLLDETSMTGQNGHPNTNMVRPMNENHQFGAGSTHLGVAQQNTCDNSEEQ